MVRANRPTVKEENLLRRQGYKHIAGIDEAGRGALMGPVVAAAVIMPQRVHGDWRSRVRDSKLVPEPERELLYEKIVASAVAWGVGIISNTVIDDIGIAPAGRRAMVEAVKQLTPQPDYIIIDFFTVPELSIPHHGITHGDGLCFSIACASIVAKVTRDRLVTAMEEEYPHYRFSAHKGYSTEDHLSCLEKFGPCPLHRRSYEPVRNICDRLL